MNVIIIGPGEHFGQALIDAFRGPSNEVVIASRTQGTHVGAQWMQLDVSQTESVKNFSRALPWSHVDCVIFNVKDSPAGTFMELNPDRLLAAINVNVVGLLRLLQSLGSRMGSRERNMPVVISTGGGYKDNPHASKFALSLSKAALHALAENLRLAMLSSRGIQLKSLVIDGQVRHDGPIQPELVASVAASMAMGEVSGAVVVLRNHDGRQCALDIDREEVLF